MPEETKAPGSAEETGPVVGASREDVVMAAITDPDRFPRLKFLGNCAKELADYGKPRPAGEEIVAALDAINSLATAYYNTPNRRTGQWDEYFVTLPGWTHSNGESTRTMALYGKQRRFSDQENGRLLEIQRHLTYRGSSGGLQIFFDRDDLGDRFIIGYIGEHLDYASSPS